MATARQIIKQWFSNFKKPTQEHFWAWIDSFWHKNEKIPMSSVQNLEQSLQNVVTSDQFNNHINDGNAHQALFDKKVDKEDGKSLISDAERNQIQINKNKQVVGHTITGDVNKVSTLLLDDGSVIQADFTDVAPAGPDVMLNSLNFNIETGVFTGVRSDGQQLTVGLNGRFALLNHTHQIADVADLEDALNGKAASNHTHAFSDLSGTENIATKQEITDAVDGIKIGCRNLVLNSSKKTIISEYRIGAWRLSQNLVVGKTYRITIWGEIPEGHQFYVGRSPSTNHLISASKIDKGVYSVVFQYNRNTASNIDKDNEVVLYFIGSSNYSGYLDKITISEGKLFIDWYPAPEDFVSKSELEDVIDVDTIDEIGDFKPKSGNIRPHISPTGNFSVFAGEIGSGELLMQVDRYTGIKSPKHIDGQVVSARKLRASVIDSSWVDLDSRNGELNVTNPVNENDYAPIKAEGFKMPNGDKDFVLTSDGGRVYYMKGFPYSSGGYRPNKNILQSNVIFLTGDINKNIYLEDLEDNTILSFKKCYDGGNVNFICQGKTIVMRGADVFNGKDGSNAVVSIVDNKCYIDINNYE